MTRQNDTASDPQLELIRGLCQLISLEAHNAELPPDTLRTSKELAVLWLEWIASDLSTMPPQRAFDWLAQVLHSINTVNPPGWPSETAQTILDDWGWPCRSA